MQPFSNIQELAPVAEPCRVSQIKSNGRLVIARHRQLQPRRKHEMRLLLDAKLKQLVF